MVIIFHLGHFVYSNNIDKDVNRLKEIRKRTPAERFENYTWKMSGYPPCIELVQRVVRISLRIYIWIYSNHENGGTMAVAKKLISMDKALANELSTVSKLLGVSQKEIVEKALDFYFDYLDVAIAEKISKDIEEGRVKVYDAEEVFKELGINV